MNKIIFFFMLFPTLAYGQGMSLYGDWGQPPETKRHYYDPTPDFEFEFFPDFDPNPYTTPVRPYENNIPDWGETRPFLKVTPQKNVRPNLSPVEPEVVDFSNDEEFGTVLISTKDRFLLFTLNKEQAYMYPIGVGRQGFTWSGQEKVSRIEYWPEWIPPKEMLARRPDLPDRMRGGINNPLGAVAIYLGNSLYRIHGTNEPKSIGKAESSGCFRMMNEHALHLASIVDIGTTVKVYK